jgi:Zn-dependent protease with chaperone function
MALEGQYFDGRTARRHGVSVEVRGGELHVLGGEIDRRVPLGEVRLSASVGSIRRVVIFADGATCEIPHPDEAFSMLLAEGGLGEGAVARWYSDWRWVAGGLVLLAAAAFGGYRWAAPWVAAVAAPRVPATVVDRLSTETLRLLDNSVFRPTRLPQERRDGLTARLAAITAPGTERPAWVIQFRDAGDAGATAIALPSGTIVVTDQLVRLAVSDDEVAGVMAHELGHVQGRHGLRMALQGSLVAGAMALYLGDFSGVAATAPVVLAQAKYSRDFEREADDYAADLLAAHDIPPSLLADILERIDAGTPRDPDAAREGGAGPGWGLLRYTASHPDIVERVARLRSRAASGRDVRPAP